MAFNFFNDGVHRIIRVSADSTVSASDFSDNVYYVTADLSGGSVTTTFDAGIPDGYIIHAGVYVEQDANRHSLFTSTPLVEQFANNKGVAAADGGSYIDIEGVATFVKSGTQWIQVEGFQSNLDSSDDQVVFVSVNTFAEVPAPNTVNAGTSYFVLNDPNPTLNGLWSAAGADIGNTAVYWENS